VFHDLGAAEDSSAVAGEEVEQVELGRGEGDAAPVDLDGVSCEVDWVSLLRDDLPGRVDDEPLTTVARGPGKALERFEAIRSELSERPGRRKQTPKFS